MRLEFKGKNIRISGSDENPLFNFSDIIGSLNYDYSKQHNQFIATHQSNVWIEIQGNVYLTEFGLYKYLFQDDSDIASEFQMHVLQLLKALRLGQIKLEFIGNSDIKQSIDTKTTSIMSQLINCGIQQKISDHIMEYQSLANLKQLGIITNEQQQQYEQIRGDIYYDCFQFSRYYEGVPLTPENWDPKFDIYY